MLELELAEQDAKINNWSCSCSCRSKEIAPSTNIPNSDRALASRFIPWFGCGDLLGASRGQDNSRV